MITSLKKVDQYLASQPKEIREILEQLRLTIKTTAPDAEESISYGMPAYKQNGPLVYFAAFKNHIGFFPTSSGVKEFKDELSQYKTSKGTIRFPLDKPLPIELIKKIVKFRLEENTGKLS